MMKKKLTMLFAIFLIITVGSYGITVLANRDYTHTEQKQNQIKIVTSFYPMYVLTANLIQGVDGISLVNLTENQTGCLHDYQMTTQDMRKLAEADYFVMNGGGMESFVEDTLANYPTLKVIDASEGIQMLADTTEHTHDHETEVVEGEDHDHDEDDHDEDVADHHDHDHGEYNAHVWMNMNDYLVQIDNVSKALSELDPANQAVYEKNAKEYSQKVKAVQKEYQETLQAIKNQDIVIFHDAFAYLAQELGMNVVYTIEMETDTSLSAGEIKEIIDEVNTHDVRMLFTEEQFSDSIAKTIATETNAKVYVIDSLVTGEYSLDAYLEGMRQNLQTLKTAINNLGLE